MKTYSSQYKNDPTPTHAGIILNVGKNNIIQRLAYFVAALGKKLHFK
jgi:hypothetical protein